jgi:transcriptional regulator with XRE-family HTH domain
MNLRLSELGPLVLEKRGTLGVRAAAAEVGISPATFSRIENGNMPDLESFAKVCTWLGRDPSEFLGAAPGKQPQRVAAVHFRKDQTTSHATAASLAKLILAAQSALQAKAGLVE